MESYIKASLYYIYINGYQPGDQGPIRGLKINQNI